MIVVRYLRADDLLHDYFHHGRLGGLFVSTRQSLPAGAEVPVEVRFADGKTFRTRCRVAWRRVAGASDLPAGLGLEFLSTERRVRDMLLAYASGHAIDYSPRGTARVPARLKVRLKTVHGLVEDVTEDISEDGLFLHTATPLPVGTRATLTLKPPGRILGFTVQGVVAREKQGRDGGVGIRFEIGSERERRKLTSLVRALRRETAPFVTLVTPVKGTGGSR